MVASCLDLYGVLEGALNLGSSQTWSNKYTGCLVVKLYATTACWIAASSYNKLRKCAESELPALGLGECVTAPLCIRTKYKPLSVNRFGEPFGETCLGFNANFSQADALNLETVNLVDLGMSATYKYLLRALATKRRMDRGCKSMPSGSSVGSASINLANSVGRSYAAECTQYWPTNNNPVVSKDGTITVSLERCQ